MQLFSSHKQTNHTAQTVMQMTQGNPYSLLVRFALPVFLSQIFQQLYNTADSLIVGRILGTEALAAVSSSSSLIFLMVSLCEGIAMGSSIVISRYFGARDHDKVSRAIHTNIAFGLISGLILTVLGILLTPTILVWMNTDPEVLPDAIAYFRVYFAGILTITMYNNCRSIMTAVGDSRRPLYYLIISSVLNIGLDLLFIGVFRWGVWSAAFATVIAQAISVILCLIHLFHPHFMFKIHLKKIRFHFDMLKEIVRYGLPAGIQFSVIGFANTIVQAQVNSFGKVAMAAFGAHFKIEGFASLPITSFMTAITTFTSQNLGAKLYDRARKGARFGIFSAMLLAELIGIGYFFFAEELLALFDKSQEVIALGVEQAHVAALFYFLLAFSHSIAAVCRGSGRAFVPMLIMLAVWCVLRVVYIEVVMYFLRDIRFIYWAYPITWAISAAIYLVYYLKSDWIHGFEKPVHNPLHKLFHPKEKAL